MVITSFIIGISTLVWVFFCTKDIQKMVRKNFSFGELVVFKGLSIQ
jgi:hypothetical protein